MNLLNTFLIGRHCCTASVVADRTATKPFSQPLRSHRRLHGTLLRLQLGILVWCQNTHPWLYYMKTVNTGIQAIFLYFPSSCPGLKQLFRSNITKKSKSRLKFSFPPIILPAPYKRKRKQCRMEFYFARMHPLVNPKNPQQQSAINTISPVTLTVLPTTH
jgi:hypothetical protein